jgi:hypothetical protein
MATLRTFGASYTFMIPGLPMRPGFYIGVNMEGVALLGTRIYLAVDASSVTAAEIADSVKGRRLRTLAHEPLAAGALVPGAAGSNLADAEAVRAAMGRALGRVSRSRVTLVLPDGIARLALLEPSRGVPTREYVRYRLASSLPWPATEASFDAIDAGSGRVVGAAIRRTTVAEYEQAATAVGANVEQVHLAPLLALAGLRGQDADAAHAVLGDVAMCLVFVRDRALLALRSRRRDRSQGEAARLREELRKLAAGTANGNGNVPLVVSGSDAARLRPQIGAAGLLDGVAPAGSPQRADEPGWLAGLLA